MSFNKVNGQWDFHIKVTWIPNGIPDELLVLNIIAVTFSWENKCVMGDMEIKNTACAVGEDTATWRKGCTLLN